MKYAKGDYGLIIELIVAIVSVVGLIYLNFDFSLNFKLILLGVVIP
jgi:hypothetical protein